VFDGRDETVQAAFQEVVVDTFLQAADDGLLLQFAGEQQKGDVQIELVQESIGIQAAEAAGVVVAQDDVESVFAQRLAHAGRILHTLVLQRIAGIGQFG